MLYARKRSICVCLTAPGSWQSIVYIIFVDSFHHTLHLISRRVALDFIIHCAYKSIQLFRPCCISSKCCKVPDSPFCNIIQPPKTDLQTLLFLCTFAVFTGLFQKFKPYALLGNQVFAPHTASTHHESVIRLLWSYKTNYLIYPIRVYHRFCPTSIPLYPPFLYSLTWRTNSEPWVGRMT